MLLMDLATEERYRVLDAVSTVHGALIHMRVESTTGEASGWRAVVSSDDTFNLAKLGTSPQEIAAHGACVLIGSEFSALPVDDEWIMLPEETPAVPRRGLLASSSV